VRLLFDENLSHRLVDRLADLYPGSQHVRQLEMASAPDRIIVGYAGIMDMVLVTKDGDFDDLALLAEGAARVLRLDLGNCTTDEIESTLRGAADDLKAIFEVNQLVALGRRRPDQGA
jgi:predicted nuclease of predicted toxin-antitoxin system